MKHPNSMTTASLIFLLFTTFSQAAPKPKYGTEATLLSKSHAYMQSHLAPDFWSMIPHYTAQQTGSACSVASVAMVVNAARSGQALTADDELVTQNSLLKKVGDEEWTKAVGDHGGGRSLDQLGPLVEKSMKAYGFEKVHVETVHTHDLSDATKKKLHQALVENEKSARDFILVNFIQGAYTGDADVGHIAPVAAYDSVNNRVLVLDPDREWYEPYWVSEETLLKGMATVDKGSGKERGYVWVKVGY